MATINDIKAYVHETPYNTNPNVLDSLLDSLEISGDKVIYEKSVSFLGVEPYQQESLDFYQIEDSSLNDLSITENTIVYINGDQAEMHLQNGYWQAIIENEDGGIVVGSDSETGIIGIYTLSGEPIPDEYIDINVKIINPTQQEEESGIIVATIVNHNVSTRTIPTISYTCDYTYEQLSTLIQSKEVYFKGDKMENMESDRLYQGDFIIGSDNSFILIIIENNYEITITDEGIEVNYRNSETPMT